MRLIVASLALGLIGAALLPAQQAKAWWDSWGRWHPVYVRPYVYAPPPPYYYRPYARWVPPHYDSWGRFIPGHWA